MYFKKLGAWLVGRNDLPQQFRRYKQTVFWLYREVFRRRPGTALLALGTNFLGPVLMGSAMGLLIYFANKMESNTALNFGLGPVQLSLQPREPTDFGIVVVCIGLMMLASGIVIFLANYITIHLTLQIAQDESKSVLMLYGGRPWRRQNPEASPYPKDVLRCAYGIIPLTRAIRPLLRLCQPLSFLLFSLAALLYFNPFLTMILAVVGLPSLFFQYRINYTAAKNQELMGPALRKMQRGITRQLNALALAPRPGRSKGMTSYLDDVYAQENIQELPNRYAIRVLANSKSQAVSSILIAVLSVIIVTHLGFNALTGKTSWSLVLGYILFARIAMMAMRNLLGTITGFARHYPKSRRIYELLTSWPGRTKLHDDYIRIRRKNRENPGDIKSGKLRRGEVLGALSPVPFTRYNTFAWADALAANTNIDKRSLWGAMTCIPDAVNCCPGETLRELCGLPQDLSQEHVRKAGNDLYDEADLSQINVDAIIDEETWRTLPKPFRCHLLLDLGAREGGDIILVEHKVINGAQELFLKDWWAKVANRFVVVRYPKNSKLGIFEEKFVIAMRMDRITAIMSIEWATQNMTLLNDWFSASQAQNIEEDEDELADDD